MCCNCHPVQFQNGIQKAGRSQKSICGPVIRSLLNWSVWLAFIYKTCRRLFPFLQQWFSNSTKLYCLFIVLHFDLMSHAWILLMQHFQLKFFSFYLGTAVSQMPPDSERPFNPPYPNPKPVMFFLTVWPYLELGCMVSQTPASLWGSYALSKIWAMLRSLQNPCHFLGSPKWRWSGY